MAAEGPDAAGVIQNVRQALFVNSIEPVILVLVIVVMTTKPGV